jgi:hypothetical protein
MHNAPENEAAAELLAQVFPRLLNITWLDLGQNGGIVTDQVVQTILQHLTKLQTLLLCKSKVTDLGLAGRYIDMYDPRLPVRAVEARQVVVHAHMAAFEEPGLCLTRLKRKINQWILPNYDSAITTRSTTTRQLRLRQLRLGHLRLQSTTTRSTTTRPITTPVKYDSVNYDSDI